jgi:hypothetical protein
VEPVKKGKHEQREAFHVMEYCCGDLRHSFFVWNSRDGVTPFIVQCPDCDKDSQHVHWEDDVYAPDNKPETGQWAFVDLTIEMARAYRLVFVERFWDSHMKEMFGTKKRAVEDLAQNDVKAFAPHTPHLTRWE